MSRKPHNINKFIQEKLELLIAEPSDDEVIELPESLRNRIAELVAECVAVYRNEQKTQKENKPTLA